LSELFFLFTDPIKALFFGVPFEGAEDKALEENPFERVILRVDFS
jgi:hypothetical protein